MKKLINQATVLKNNTPTGTLEQFEHNSFTFTYLPTYSGEPISLTMPVQLSPFNYNNFPPFFEGLLPEGVMLEAMLKQTKIDSKDYFSQLLHLGHNLVGDITVENIQS